MKFLDSNIAIYAFFRPKRRLPPAELALKEKSREILKRVDQGEKVMLSVVHLSEIANVLQTCFSAEDLRELFLALYAKDNVLVLGVTEQDYLEAIDYSRQLQGRVNDALAVVLMRQQGIREIYTFDKDFKQAEGIVMVN